MYGNKARNYYSGSNRYRFDADIKPHIVRKKWHPSQEEKELKDGRLEVRFKVNGTEGIRQWIYRWVPFVEIVSPKELREEVFDELNMAAEKNRQPKLK